MKKYFLTSFVFVFTAFQLTAQKFETALARLALEHQPQKIYIHYDREYYVSGETIFFKAYLFSDGKPSGASNNLYLQFTDSKGAVVSTQSFPVMGAVAKGSIDIPDSLPQGNYYLRAITPAMLDYDEAFIYKKNIFVFKPAATISSEKTAAQNVSVQFFPESGDLVDGILTVVGFKAVDQWGTPVEVNGIIRTGEGTTIASFKTYHDGIGKVPFKPQVGKKYTAEVETVAGKRTYQLPEVKAAGINLKIQDEKMQDGTRGKKFQLSRSEKDKALFGTVVLVAAINNHVVYENEISFEDYPSVIGHIVTDSLPSGILHFTVFNKDGVPLAERLSFVDNQEYVSSGSIAATKISEAKRAENNIELSFPDAIQRSCSVAITDASGSSFNDDDISISGTVMDEKNKEALENGRLNLYVEAEDSTTQNYEVKVNAAGKFRMDSLLFFGKAKLYYAYTDSKEKPKPALVILTDNTLAKLITVLPGTMLNNVMVRDINTTRSKEEINTRYGYVKSRLDEVKELEQVTVHAVSNKKPIDIVNEKYTTGVFRSPGKVNLDNINQPANDKSLNAVDYIKNRIQQIEIQGGNIVNRKNMSLISGQKWAVGVFIDEAPATVLELRLLRADELALVKFYEAGFVGVGSNFPGGALAVYTKDRSNEDVKPDKLSFVEYNGYSISKQFYAPDYNNADQKHPVSDSRTTLYWNPDIYTDGETTSMKLNFFNNDFSKKFKIVIEGFDATGKLIHLEKVVGN